MVRNIQAEIPAYLRNADSATLADVHTHCEAHAGLILDRVAREPRAAPRGSSASPAPPAARRVEQGIPIDGLLAAFRVGHRTVWDAILDEAGDTPVGRDAAIALARPAMEYIDTASTQVAEAYTKELAKREAAAGPRAARPDREPAGRPRAEVRPSASPPGWTRRPPWWWRWPP